MPSLNAIQLFDEEQPMAATRVSSEIVRVQGVREELVTFWFLVTGTLTSGSAQIRVAPDDASRALTTPAGMVVHSVVWTGTANSPTLTKVNGQGHALVTVVAMPLMWVDIQGTSGDEVVTCFLIE